MDPVRIAELVIKYARDRGVDEVEAYVAWSDGCTVSITRSGLESIVSGYDIAVGVRVVKGKRISIAGAHISAEEDVRRIVEKAISTLRACPVDEKWVSLAREVGYSQVADIVDSSIAESPTDVAVEISSKLFELPRSLDPKAQLVEGLVGCGHGGKVIASSYTSKPLEMKKTGIEAWFAVRVSTDRGEGTVSDFVAATKLSDVNVDKLVARNVEWARQCAGASPIETGSYDIVLAPKVFGSILNVLISPAVSALNVQRGRSPLRDKLGQQVLSDKLTIVDDGSAPGLVGTAPFDDEGVPTSRKTVFSKGVLSTYLYDSYTAYAEGKKPTGNAVRSGVASPPAPGVTNMLVIPGSGTIDDLVKDVKRGILVINVIGEWLSNFVSGFLNFTVSAGLLIENGRVSKPVTGVVVSGNIYELLKDKLVALGSDVENLGNVYAPSALISGASVAGK